MSRRFVTPVLTLVLLMALAAPASAEDPGQMWFPTQNVPGMNYGDTWGQARSGGRSHTGTDIMGPQMSEVYAAASGSVLAYKGACAVGQYCSSYYLLLGGNDGRSYFYVHINNDTPGRPAGCDGTGGAENAFAPRLAKYLRANGTLVGMPVTRGEHVAYTGSSGNAGCRVDHTHFEIWNGVGWGAPKVNPYTALRAAQSAGNIWGAEGSSVGKAPAPAPAPAPVLPDPVDNRRIRGDNRVLTAVEMSREAFDAATTVVLAPAGVYAEALVAAPLAATLDAPVLLAFDHQAASQDVLDGSVATEIKRLGATKAVIVGSEERLDGVLEQQLTAKTGIAAAAIQRIGGADRYELSQSVATQILGYHGIGTSGTTTRFAVTPNADPQTTMSPILALGENEVMSRGWADALAATVLAARDTTPILLTRPGDLPEATRKILAGPGIGEVRIVGGTGAVSAKVEDAVKSLGRTTRRLAGADRYATSQSLMREAEKGGADDRETFVATGLNFPDALASGPAIARLGHQMILVDGRWEGQPESVERWLRVRAEAIQELVGVGGPAAIADEALLRLATYANWPENAK